MKNVINIVRKQYKIVVGIFIGVFIMGSVSYAVDNLSSESVSYTKDGNVTTVKKALDDLIGKSLAQIDELKEKTKVYKYAKLADVVEVGDYVAYDAGDWNSATDKPKIHGNFGGNAASTNKGMSVACRENLAPKLNGWRVLKKENDKVYLVHAGVPECYYHGSGTSDSQNKLNERAQSTYVDNKYADSAHAMNHDEALKITGTTGFTENDLRAIGTYYYLATAYDIYYMWGVESGGRMNLSSSDYLFGFRPVIVLKSDVLTTGRGTDQFNNPNAWNLALLTQ